MRALARLSLLAALSGCAAPTEPQTPLERAPVEVVTEASHEQLLADTYRTSGTVRGHSTAVISSKVSGVVRAVAVHPGDRVRAGQLVVTLEASGVVAGVRRARAGLDQSIAARAELQNMLEGAQVNARIASSSHARVTALLATQAVSQQQFDEDDARARAAASQEQAVQARLNSTVARIEQSKAEIAEADSLLSATRIVAPFDGRVIERRIDPGTLATPGAPLLVMEEDGALRVETAVDEKRAASIQIGQQATVELDDRARPIEARVTEIVPMVDISSRAFVVKLDLPIGSTALRPGMFARVAFELGTRPRLVVPSSAISSAGAIDRLFVVDADRARLRMITAGEVRGGSTEILSGLSAGERVLSAPPSTLRDGDRVVVR